MGTTLLDVGCTGCYTCDGPCCDSIGDINCTIAFSGGGLCCAQCATEFDGSYLLNATAYGSCTRNNGAFASSTTNCSGAAYHPRAINIYFGLQPSGGLGSSFPWDRSGGYSGEILATVAVTYGSSPGGGNLETRWYYFERSTCTTGAMSYLSSAETNVVYSVAACSVSLTLDSIV